MLKELARLLVDSDKYTFRIADEAIHKSVNRVVESTKKEELAVNDKRKI